MKKTALTIVCLVCLSSIMSGYTVQAGFGIYSTLSFSGQSNVTGQRIFHAYTTLNFSGQANITQNNAPTFVNPSPSNESTGVSIDTTTWNVTINDGDEDAFNWSIDTSPNVGNNSLTDDTDGSKSVTISGLTYDTTYYVMVNATDNQSNTANAVYWFSTEKQVGPVISNPNPANQSTGNSMSLETWNVTIEDGEGDNFNWTIETVPLIGGNSSDNVGNGSYSIGIAGNMSYSTTYTVFVNATEINSANFSRAVYWFTMTGGELNVTINGTVGIEETNVTMLGYMQNNDSEDSTVYFEYNKYTNDFSTPTGNTSAGIQPQNTEFSLNITGLDSGTFYYARTIANNSNGWNASWNSTYFITKPQPASGMSISETDLGFNITWSHGDGANLSYLVVNEYNIPVDRSNGTNIYSGANDYYEHVGLTIGETYYYRVWEYANWGEPAVAQWSDGNTSDYETYQGLVVVFLSPNPANNSYEVSISTTTWNVTIESPNANLFNWSIDTAVGNNSLTSDSNGSKEVNIAGNLSYGTMYTVWVNASEVAEVNSTNATYYFMTGNNTAPDFSNPNPANESTNVVKTTDMWNITINDENGNTFDWSIESYPDVGSNSSNNDDNGSKWIDMGSNLSYEQTYTIFVNASDGNSTTNETFTFTVQNNPNMTWETLSFSGQINVQSENPTVSNPQPSDEATGVSVYPTLNITVTETQGEKFNITWASNYSGVWTDIAFNSTLTNGTYQQRATWANTSEVTYWWQVKVNDSSGHWTNETYSFTIANYTWGNWSSWWTFNYSILAPSNLSASAYNNSVINLTWTEGDGCDTYVLLRNVSGWTNYPLTPFNGTEIYNGTNLYYNDTELENFTTYYYAIWGWNDTDGNYSLQNDTASAMTQGDFTICCEYPYNTTSSVARPPVNISALINGSSLDIYFYALNKTSSVTGTWEEVGSWSGVSSGRYEVTIATLSSYANQFIWGDTSYNWSINATNGVLWLNYTYNYTTTGSRYDVKNTSDVTATDVITVWNHRTGEQSYDGIYDVDASGDITATDVSLVWANRT